MKILKKFIPLMLAAVLLFAALPASVEAANKSAYAGDTVTLEIPVQEGFGGQGTVKFEASNAASFTLQSVSSANLDGLTYNDANGKFSFAAAGSDEITNGAIIVKVAVNASAQKGDTYKVTVEGYQYVDASDNMVSGSLAAQTITVDAKVTESGTGSNTGSDTGSNSGSNSGSSNTGSPNTDNDKSEEKEEVDTTDYSELKKQSGIANELESDGYTKESWEALQVALEKANAAQGSGDQAKVDAAAKALADAIAGLTKIDYSKLEEAIASAEALISADEIGQKWGELFTALENGSAMLTSNSQADVDAAAEQITKVLDELKVLLEELNKEDEPVNTEPEGDYCNIPIHKVWPILFFISLALNILLIVLLVKKNKEKQVDDTPMVNYQIGDDDK